MLDRHLPYLSYARSEDVPNIVVDGRPNRSTVLALSHWPGVPSPPGYEADLSAEMAFKYVERPLAHPPARAVTNTHYDQDGIVSIFALTDPGEAVRHRERLIEVARAGDFMTYHDRTAARAAMVIGAYADPERSPIQAELRGRSDDDRCRILYERTLPLLVPMVIDPERFKPLWEQEDAILGASEAAIDSGTIAIEERPTLELSIVRAPVTLPEHAGVPLPYIHPMAVHNAIRGFRKLTVRGNRYRYVDRYETWVKYQASRPLPRVDLRPLAAELSALEPGGVSWRADPPSALYPRLSHGGSSGLSEVVVRQHIEQHLETAKPAWNPHAVPPEGTAAA